MPRVSVAIRAYRRRWLGHAIASVLAQTWRDLELIVYDDAGDLEDLAVAAADPRVRYVRAANHAGASGRFAAAVGHCTGEFVAVLDDDDYYAPTFIERLVLTLVEQPTAGIAFCRTTFDVDGRLSVPSDGRGAGLMQDAARRMLAERWTVSTSHMLMRRAALDAAWREQPMPDGVSPDMFVNMAVALAGWNHVLVDERLVVSRWHDAQLSRRGDAADLPIATWRTLRLDDSELQRLRDRLLARALLARAVLRLCEGQRTAAADDVEAAGEAAPGVWPTSRLILRWAAQAGAPASMLARACMSVSPRGLYRARPALHIGDVPSPRR